ncbi:class I SAM-dependent methyltransferase [Tepidibacillus marianensis]|uniref:class I SAM-dependent methyltransferase n=1 Tax=Tepidibacillus marianensis TaxID=3131995 RepID=UPI0030CC1B04
MDQNEVIQKRYNRVAKVYDWMDVIIRDKWRKSVYDGMKGNLLEVGVGTGKNIPFYPKDAFVTGIDFSSNMLAKAKERLEKYPANVRLLLMDAQNMEFEDNTFDGVITTCVFCSVPDPIKGLKEIRRVIKPNGIVRMLEHMRSDQPVMGKMMDVINPLVVNVVGANINRDTMHNLELAGFTLKHEHQILGSMYRLLTLDPNKKVSIFQRTFVVRSLSGLYRR